MHSELSLEAGAVFGLDKQGDVRRLAVNLRFGRHSRMNKDPRICWILTGGVYHIGKPKRPVLNPSNGFADLTHGFKNSSKAYEVFAGGESEWPDCVAA